MEIQYHWETYLQDLLSGPPGTPWSSSLFPSLVAARQRRVQLEALHDLQQLVEVEVRHRLAGGDGQQLVRGERGGRVRFARGLREINIVISAAEDEKLQYYGTYPLNE